MSTALAILAAAVLAQAQPQAPKVDRVTPKKGTPVEGEIQKDTWKDVVVKVGAASQTLRADDVQRVEYWDAPPAFKGAMAAMDQEKWSEAIPALASAEEYSKSKEKNVVKPRPWFEGYLLFHRGYCQMQVGKTSQAVPQFEKLINEPAFKESRFLAQAYELLLECHRELGDVARMEEVEKKIEAAPAELKADLQTRARRQRAELLYDKNKYDEAKKLFELITSSPDADVAAAGTMGVIKCLEGLKDAPGIETYCNKVLTTAVQPSLLLIATNALGNIAFEKKQFTQARDRYIQSVVRHNPGRTGTGIEREHEKSIYRLGQCYEALLAEAKDEKLKEALSAMASSAFREVSIEYPSGKYREQAIALAQKYEKKDDKKDDKKEDKK